MTGLPRLHTRLRKMEPPLSLPVPLVMPLTAVASNGGTITLLKDVTATNFNTTISKNVTIQGKEGLKINLTTGSTSRNKAFTVSKDAKLTLDGVTMMISGSGEEGQGIGDGFDVQYGGALELNNSNVTPL